MDPPGVRLAAATRERASGNSAPNSRSLSLTMVVSEGRGLGGDQKIVAPNRSGQTFRAVREECRS